MISRHFLAILGVPAALLTLVAVAHGEPTTCKRAIVKASAQLARTIVKAQQQCADGIVSGRLVGPCPDAMTLLTVGKAEDKLKTALNTKCGGPDKSCGAGTDELLSSIGWDLGACPGLEGSTCPNTIADCNDIANCLICLNEAASTQVLNLYYDHFISTADTELQLCQRTIGKAEAGFFIKKSKQLQTCEDAVLAGTSSQPCPDVKTTARIAQARAKASEQVCKLCGGPDRVCQGLGTDLAPAAIGFASNCPPVTVPETGPACSREINNLQDIVSCTTCVTDFKTSCLDAAGVPALRSFPADCAQATSTPNPTATPTLTVASPTATATGNPTTTPSPSPTSTPPPDLIFASPFQSNIVCLNNGAGVFACNNLPPALNGRTSVAVGDLNDDHKLDAVFVRETGTTDRTCLGDGMGSFTCSSITGAVTASSRTVALGDLNDDGKLDAVFGHDNDQRNRACSGDGAGQFPTCADVSPDRGLTFGVALGRVNSDAELDVIFARYYQNTNLVCLGTGNGTFTPCTAVGPETEDSLAVALGDVNNDDKLDAVFANMERIPPANPPTRNRACLGDGAGAFTCGEVSPESARFAGVALGDVNEDGNLDAVFAVSDAGDVLGNRVCLGNGGGGFSCSGLGAGAHGSNRVVVVDLNGDGHLDTVFANNDAASACFGNGQGSFTCSEVGPGVTGTQDVAAGRFMW